MIADSRICLEALWDFFSFDWMIDYCSIIVPFVLTDFNFFFSIISSCYKW